MCESVSPTDTYDAKGEPAKNGQQRTSVSRAPKNGRDPRRQLPRGRALLRLGLNRASYFAARALPTSMPFTALRPQQVPAPWLG